MKNLLLLVFMIFSLVILAALPAHAVTQIGGSFALINQEAKSISDKDFQGRYMLVFFGFTHCPDVCPTTLLTLSQTLDQLKGDANKIAPVFITVDPEKDTPPVMKAFLTHFSPAITGLTGSKTQIDKIEADYKTYSLKVDNPRSSTGYGFEHSSYIYLMDQQGQFLTVFTADSSPQSIAGRIKTYLKDK